MFPNQQQPPQTPPPTPPNTGGNSGFGPQPVPGTPTPQQPQFQPQPQANPYAQPQQPQPLPPQQPGYGPQPAPTYAVDYLDQIAPPPPKPNFLSGAFGKAFIALMVVFVFAVSLIVAFGNQKKTADIEQIATRLDNIQKIAKNTQKELKNSKLLALNSNLQIWSAGSNREAFDLLAQAEVQKTDMDKKMIAAETEKKKELEAKFEDARLNANLDRVYAREMAYQTDILVTLYTTMSKKSEAKAIREYAKKSIQNLTPIQKSFAEYDDKI